MLACRKFYHVGAVSRQRRTGISEMFRAEQGDVITLGYDRPDGGAFYRRRRDEIELLTGSGLDSSGSGRSRAAGNGRAAGASTLVDLGNQGLEDQ